MLFVLLPIATFFGYREPMNPSELRVAIATSSPLTASTTTPLPASTTMPVPTQVPPSKVPINIPPTPPIIPIEPVLPKATSTQVRTIGETTLAIQSIPLLFGGTVQAGQSIPIAYLQITNIGSEGALLKGFWIKQNGTAPTESIIGLSTIDDKSGLRGSVGGMEGIILFQNGSGFAPTDAYFAPGQMRLFTIKASMAGNISLYLGTQIVIDLIGLDTTATVREPLPIRGTTWTIVQ